MQITAIDEAFEVAERHLAATSSWNTEVEAFLARHLVVLIYSRYEEELRSAVTDFATPFENKHLAAFITAAGKTLLRRLKPEDLAGCLGQFGSEIKEIFGLKTNASTAKTDYEAILGYRHETAHGPGAVVTVKDLKRLYISSLDVLEAFKEALEATMPPAV